MVSSRQSLGIYAYLKKKSVWRFWYASTSSGHYVSNTEIILALVIQYYG